MTEEHELKKRIQNLLSNLMISEDCMFHLPATKKQLRFLFQVWDTRADDERNRKS